MTYFYRLGRTSIFFRRSSFHNLRLHVFFFILLSLVFQIQFRLIFLWSNSICSWNGRVFNCGWRIPSRHHTGLPSISFRFFSFFGVLLSNFKSIHFDCWWSLETFLQCCKWFFQFWQVTNLNAYSYFIL